MHSLPDNALNPLGLLAEASLANRRAQAGAKSQITEAVHTSDKVGVASDVYFKPGESSRCVPCGAGLTIDLHRTHDDTTITEVVYRAANPARDA